jgi:hypothetical protein
VGFNKNLHDGIFFTEYETDFFSEYRALTIAEIIDNSSYVYETAKDPFREGVIFKVDIREKGRYSFQVDKTSKRSYNHK